MDTIQSSVATPSLNPTALNRYCPGQPHSEREGEKGGCGGRKPSLTIGGMCQTVDKLVSVVLQHSHCEGKGINANHNTKLQPKILRTEWQKKLLHVIYINNYNTTS